MDNLRKDVAKNATQKAQTLQKGVKAAQKIIQSNGQTQPVVSEPKQQWQLGSVASQQVAQNGRAFINAQQTQPAIAPPVDYSKLTQELIEREQQKLENLHSLATQKAKELFIFNRAWKPELKTLSAQQKEQIQQKITQNKENNQFIRDMLLSLIPNEEDKEEVKQKLQQQVEIEKQISDTVLPLLPEDKRLIAEQQKTKDEWQIYESTREILEILPGNQRKKIAIQILDEHIKIYQAKKDKIKTMSEEDIKQQIAEPLAIRGRKEEIKEQTIVVLYKLLSEEQKKYIKNQNLLAYKCDQEDLRYFIKKRAKYEQEKAGYPRGRLLKIPINNQQAPFNLRTFILGLYFGKLNMTSYAIANYYDNLDLLRDELPELQEEFFKKTSDKLSQDQQQALKQQMIYIELRDAMASIRNQEMVMKLLNSQT